MHFTAWRPGQARNRVNDVAHGIPVSGSDRQDSKYLRSLEARGHASTSATEQSSLVMRARSSRPRRSGRAIRSFPRLGAVACECCIAAPRSAR